jgi:hypothetical protein
MAFRKRFTGMDRERILDANDRRYPQREYATAVLLDDDCGLWPECDCDEGCAKKQSVAARPMFRLVEAILLVSILILGAFVLWAMVHLQGGIHV